MNSIHIDTVKVKLISTCRLQPKSNINISLTSKPIGYLYFCFTHITQMKYIVSIIVTLLIFSCKSAKEEAYATYFGGEVINPRSNFVLFLKDNKVIDTLQLDDDHRFMRKFEKLDEGLYTFKHGLEFQYVYLEPADSVLVRLNTWDFDESVVFNGNGGSKNEFLINLFLQNEKEEKAMYKYFSLNEDDFEKKIDSLAKERETIYNNFELNEAFVSEGFKNLTNTAIHYPLFRLKEIYPLYHRNAHKLNNFPEVSDSFYDFRNSIDLNQDEFLSFYPYQNYVVNYLYNLSYQLKEADSTKNDLTINVLNSIIENISSEKIKNTLLKRIVVNDFLKSESTCTINNEKLSIFLKNCTDEEAINQVQNLVNDSKFVENNESLPDFDVISYSNEQSTIKEITNNKKTVIYFWSTEYMSVDYLVSRVSFLERKYPAIDFIGVQMQPAFLNTTNEPKLRKLNSDKQFKLTSDSFANNFLTSRYPRIIIVENDGIVMNGFTYLDSKKLWKELKKIQNK